MGEQEVIPDAEDRCAFVVVSYEGTAVARCSHDIFVPSVPEQSAQSTSALGISWGIRAAVLHTPTQPRSLGREVRSLGHS
jgi:hypothetical protein